MAYTRSSNVRCLYVVPPSATCSSVSRGNAAACEEGLGIRLEAGPVRCRHGPDRSGRSSAREWVLSTDGVPTPPQRGERLTRATRTLGGAGPSPTPPYWSPNSRGHPGSGVAYRLGCNKCPRMSSTPRVTSSSRATRADASCTSGGSRAAPSNGASPWPGPRRRLWYAGSGQSR